MTRLFDPRSRYRKPARTAARAELVLTRELAEKMLGAVILQGGEPTCKECGRPATEIAMPSGTPVCKAHGDTRG